MGPERPLATSLVQHHRAQPALARTLPPSTQHCWGSASGRARTLSVAVRGS